MQSDKLKFIVEANIPFIKGLLEPFATVSYLSATETTPDAVADADAIITRTRTCCDASLLEGSRCRMIASATIGLDHVDQDYCRRHGIVVANAPGCNAPAVAQYVFASILAAIGPATSLSGLTIGIVGVGNVGKIVESWARKLGLNILLCDPPRAASERSQAFVDLDQIARRADIVTFHTPLTTAGSCPTFHLADDRFFKSLQRCPIIVNAARGAVVDTSALLSAIRSGKVGKVIIDCWESEPEINRQLLQQAFIATPHIAGYSREGKIRATQMAVNAIAARFGFEPPVIEPAPSMSLPLDEDSTIVVSDIVQSYDPISDTAALRANPEAFEQLRNDYDLRSETPVVSIH